MYISCIAESKSRHGGGKTEKSDVPNLAGKASGNALSKKTDANGPVPAGGKSNKTAAAAAAAAGAGQQAEQVNGCGKTKEKKVNLKVRS